MPEFSPSAPSAPAVFYRSYSRRKGDGSRESFEESITRTVSAIAEIGKFSKLQREMALEAGLKKHCFPSGRALWVAGTEWARKPENSPGYYNCCSMHVDDVSIFGLLMELAMMGTGTGAVLEEHVIKELPVIKRKVSIVHVCNNKKGAGGRAETLVREDDDEKVVYLVVGDSRQGWASAYTSLIELATGQLLPSYNEFGASSDVNIILDLGQVRQSGEPLKGFGGTANPVRLQETFERAAGLLGKAVGRKLTSIECCLLIDEAASAVVAGNIRRSAGMRQFTSSDKEAASAKDGLYKQDESGNWSVDPEKESLRMANHTRCFHHKPSIEDIKASIEKQFWSGEGAIMYVPEAVARANADLLNTDKLKATFLELYNKDIDQAREMLVKRSKELGEPTDARAIDHRMDRYGLNPCFAPGTIVMTREGYFPIESLVGKTVEIHDGNEWRTIDNFRVTAHDQDVYDVTLHDGTVITATEYHKFILKDGTRIELKNLKPGDELAGAEVEPIKGSVEAKGAYLKGFLIGDGTSDKGKGAFCKVYAPKKVCADRLRASIAELGAFSGLEILTGSGYLRGLSSTSEDMNEWCCKYKHIFPDEVLNWTDKAKCEFIAGLFDADGTAMDSKNGFAYQITSVSLPFLRGLVTLLRTMGIKSKIGPVRKGGIKDFGVDRGGVCQVKDTYRLTICQSASILLSRRVNFERLKSFADRQTSYSINSKSNIVSSVEFAHTAPEVYCCTVPDTHAFTLGTLLLVAQCGEILMRDNLCNLSEVHLNTIDPKDLKTQDNAFYVGGLQVAALLQQSFTQERLNYSRQLDPIVGVSFTGLFDFFVHAFGNEWLKWMMDGCADDTLWSKFYTLEKRFLSRWRQSAQKGVTDYCKQHGLRVPNRFTTVQPAGSKSLLTGASPGWHPPKAQRFIRRITFGVNDPLVSALRDYGYSVIPAQSARDENGNLLDDISDPRVQEVLVEIPTEVSWANLPGCDQHDLSKLPVASQWRLYMQVQNIYTTHNTSATLEFREEEIDVLSELMHENIQKNYGYISAALLARFDANETFPRLPFEPISKETYDRRMAVVNAVRSTLPENTTMLDLLSKYDNVNYELKGAAGCDSDKCLSEAKMPMA